MLEKFNLMLENIFIIFQGSQIFMVNISHSNIQIILLTLSRTHWSKAYLFWMQIIVTLLTICMETSSRRMQQITSTSTTHVETVKQDKEV